MCEICTGLNLTGQLDNRITRVPVDEAAVRANGWLSHEVQVYSLSEPKYGMSGEAAAYLTVSLHHGDDEAPASIVVIPTGENGKVLGPFAPLATRVGSDPAPVLAELGFVDVTAAE